MTRLGVSPTRTEYGLSRDQFRSFVAALEADGFDAHLIGRDEVEERGFACPREWLGAGRNLGGPSEVSAETAVAIYLASKVADELVRRIVRQAMDRLRPRTKRKQPCVIYGPDGEVLRRFELPPAEDE